jgi:DNA-binding response OmpR family regulator
MTDSIRVLLVEDSPTQAKEYSLYLQRAGYEVHIAEDGILALNLVDRVHPHVVILDVNLPGLNGFQVCRRLKRDNETAHIPIVMLTSADNANDTLQGLEAGADDYIPKDNFAIENLLSTLHTLQAAD